MHLTWIAVLTNQAVYLLAESKEEDALPERANLERMMDLLKKARDRTTEGQVKAIGAALVKNQKGSGLRGIELAAMDDWKRTFKA